MDDDATMPAGTPADDDAEKDDAAMPKEPTPGDESEEV